MRVRETKVSVTGDNFEIRLRRAKLFGTLRCEDGLERTRIIMKAPSLPPGIYMSQFPNFRKQITKRRGSKVSPCPLRHNLKGQ